MINKQEIFESEVTSEFEAVCSVQCSEADALSWEPFGRGNDGSVVFCSFKLHAGDMDSKKIFQFVIQGMSLRCLLKSIQLIFTVKKVLAYVF